MSKLKREYLHFKEYLDEVVPVKNPKTAKSRKYWYVHRNLRMAWHHILYALKQDQLFTFLEDETRICPRDTNRLEGGINTRIAELSQCHRGTLPVYEERLIEWFLLSKSA